jgi:hypothetical protein
MDAKIIAHKKLKNFLHVCIKHLPFPISYLSNNMWLLNFEQTELFRI